MNLATLCSHAAVELDNIRIGRPETTDYLAEVVRVLRDRVPPGRFTLRHFSLLDFRLLCRVLEQIGCREPTVAACAVAINGWTDRLDRLARERKHEAAAVKFLLKLSSQAQCERRHRRL